MKINFEKFLNIFYSIMQNDEIDCVDVNDIVEIIKIIYSSDEFEILSTRLDINEFNEEEILKNKYTIDFDEKGLISFNVAEEDINEIIENNKVDAGFIQQAINKRAMVKLTENKYNQNVIFKYDSPNGVYNMPHVKNVDYEASSSLYTDGKCTNSAFYKSSENNSTTRTVKVTDSTFTLFAYYVDGLVDKIEIRGKYTGDYFLLLNEVKRLLNGITDSYDVVINESPKVYSFKKH